jgi:CO/xanthine dehydrogenase FAD-binding subunit
MPETGPESMTDPRERVVTVASIAEALSHLATQRGQARIIAGLAGLGRRVSLPEDAYLVDVSEVVALRRVEAEAQSLSLGSAVRLGVLAQHRELGEAAPLMTVAAEHHVEQGLAGETLGARIVSSRGGDPVNIALVAVEAQAEITNLTGSQWLPVSSLFVSEGVSRVDSSTEILTRVRLPVWDGLLGAGLGITPANDRADGHTLALAVSLDERGERFERVRLAHGATWMVPALVAVGEMLVGVELGDKQRLREFVAEVIGLEMAALGDQAPAGLDEAAFRAACHQALKSAARSARQRLSATASE